MNEHSDRLVRRWLIISAVAVLIAVVIGGATRLTESGLSITEWNPVSGVLPPMSADAWDEAYGSYLQIPEAQTVHSGITLGEFKNLFWWEWIHRLMARLVGLVLALPYFFLLSKGHLRPAHRGRLLWLPILALAQGVLGWYMVSSGLAERTSVSQYRLTAHLAMALIIYMVCIWTALQLAARRAPTAIGSGRIRRWSLSAAWLTVITLLSGGFVAGLDAGKVYNTFPLMAGRVLPPNYFGSGMGWRAAFENPAIAQFNHRLLAIGTAMVILILASMARKPGVAGGVRSAATAAGALVLVQVGLGIATLLLRVPVTLGVLHQFTGFMVLTLALITAYRSRVTV